MGTCNIEIPKNKIINNINQNNLRASKESEDKTTQKDISISNEDKISSTLLNSSNKTNSSKNYNIKSLNAKKIETNNSVKNIENKDKSMYSNSFIEKSSKKSIKSNEKKVHNININNIYNAKNIIPFYKPNTMLNNKRKDVKSNQSKYGKKYFLNVNNSKNKYNLNNHRSFNKMRQKNVKKPDIIFSSNKINHIIDLSIQINDYRNEKIYLANDMFDYSSNKSYDTFSSEKDFNNIIKNSVTKNIIYQFNEHKIYLEILKLKERKWQEDLFKINKFISNYRFTENSGVGINFIFHKLINLYEHFSWLVASLGYIYSCSLYGNHMEYELNYNLSNFKLPNIFSDIWFKGFVWKGLYIRIDNYNTGAKYIKKEIKSLQYFLLDYFNIIIKEKELAKKDGINSRCYLSANIMFPLIGYCEIKSLVLIVSSIIKPDKNVYNKQYINENINIFELYSNLINDIYYRKNHYKKNLKITNKSIWVLHSIHSDRSKYEFNKISHSLDINNNFHNKLGSKNNEIKNKFDIKFLKNQFYIDDLLQSKLFTEMNKSNFIEIKEGKFILINANKIIPNLFENYFSNEIKKLNLYSVRKGEKKYFSYYYSLLTNTDIEKNNFKILGKNTIKNILEHVYKIIPLSTLKYKNVQISNINFRILFYNLKKPKENEKKEFVDILYNYEINEVENYKHVEEPYLLIYDLIEPIKLDYSLIKSVKMSDNQNEVIKNMFFYRTNYINYFLSWCDSFNIYSVNIKNYSDLKYEMKKHGINHNLLFFALVKINNNEITDIIKMHLLSKILKLILDKTNDIIVSNFIKNTDRKKNLNDIFKKKILFLIQCILYPSEISSLEKQNFKSTYEDILFYTKIFFFKYKLIDDYLSLELLNNENHLQNDIYSFYHINSEKKFLEHIILIARKKPFLFLSEIEYKFNLIIEPYIKFKSSLSLESMSRQLVTSHIYLLDCKVKSILNPEEVSGLILSKIINKYNYNNNLSKKNIGKDGYKNNNDNNQNIFKKDNLNKPVIFNTKINILLIKNNENKIYEEKSPEANKIKAYRDITNNQKDEISLTKSSMLKNNINNPPITSSNQKSKANNLIEFQKDIYDNIIISLPPNCYKIAYNYEMNNKNMSQFYTIKNINILKEWIVHLQTIFRNLTYSYNSNSEYVLLRAYIYYFIFLFYAEKNRKESLKIKNKIISLFKGNYLYKLSLNELAIINLILSLCNNDYLENEEYYSKCVLFLLLKYGDPRGRNNDSHGCLQFPLWEISRKTYKLEEPFINENFKEMYQSLDHFQKKKLELYNNIHKQRINYAMNVNKNLEKIKFIHSEDSSKYLNKNKIELLESESSNFIFSDIDENPDGNILNKDITDKDISLSTSIFDKNLLGKMFIKSYNFPSISFKSSNVIKYYNSKEFSIYIIKQIQSLITNRGIIINKSIIDKSISEYSIIPKEKLKDRVGTSVKEKEAEKIEKTPLKSKKLKYESERPKNCLNSYTKVNPFLKKKINVTSKINNDSQGKKINSCEKNFKKRNNSSNNNNKLNIIQNCFVPNEDKNLSSKKIFSKFLYIDLLQKLSFRKNVPNGLIISFGNNSHNETSHDKYEVLTLPRFIFKLKNESIIHISSGWQHNLVINDKGEVFAFGHNHEYQCGLPNSSSLKNENITDPTNISILHNNLTAIKTCCGNEHSLLIDTEHNVYGFGNNEEGLLGLEDTNIKTYKPIKINFGEYNKKIKNIACGTLHNLALTNNGNIFAWGSVQGGQLGIPPSNFLLKKKNEKNFFIKKPTLISYFKKNNVIIENISCGEAHSLALSDKGKVYSWGFGSNGQLGLGFCEDSFEPGRGLEKSRIFEPQLIKLYKDYSKPSSEDAKNKNYNYNFGNMIIKDIQCGKTFSMMIDNINNLYACGINDLSQLGLKDIEPKNNLYNPEMQCDDYVYPSLLYLSTKKVVKIACGEGHCLAIINDKNLNKYSIWSWGNNKFGQLGHGSIIKISLPKEIEFLNEYNINEYCDISCGGFHSLILLKKEGNFDWIQNDYYINILQAIEDIGNL